MPIVFSSATLSLNGSFDYMAESLGIGKGYQAFSVASPFDYPQQARLILPRLTSGNSPREKLPLVHSLLQQTGGRTLLLFPSREELDGFKQELEQQAVQTEFRFLYEGAGEISHLIAQFQQEETSVLCAVTLWEGLDIPGPSLSQVIIWSLPYPPNDPVFAAKRKDAADPFEQVDLPYMLLRVKQGFGRLIRSSADEGTVAILDGSLSDPILRERIIKLLPEGIPVEEFIAAPCAGA